MNEDRETVAQRDREYQLAIKHHDVAAIERIHADDMILVLGNGKVVTGKELEERARKADKSGEEVAADVARAKKS